MREPDSLVHVVARYIGENKLESLEGVSCAQILRSLDASFNMISSVSGIGKSCIQIVNYCEQVF